MPLFHRLIFVSVLVLIMGARGQAQIHEQAPPPGLDKGIMLTADASTLGSAKVAGDVGTEDFSIVLNAGIGVLEDAVLFRNEGWLLQLRHDGSLSFSATESAGAQPTSVTTRPGALPAQALANIVVSVKRDARQPYTGIWVNGIEVASGVMPPVRCSAANSPVQCDADKLKSLSLRIYDRALIRTEVVDLAMDFLKPPTSKNVPVSSGITSDKEGPRFVPLEGETIALVGGTEAVAVAEAGKLEAALLVAFPQKRFHFRSLAWEGDTVFRQDRPMNFGSLEQQLRRVNAGAVFLMFGRQECLDAPHGTGLAEFKAAFENLLATLKKVTSRVVVIGPAPFEARRPPLPNLADKNQDLLTYSDVMRQAAEERGLIFAKIIDKHMALVSSQFFDDPVYAKQTVDGVQLSSQGGAWVGEWIEVALRLPVPDHFKQGMGATTFPVMYYESELPESLAAKNRLWHDYWRPSNWAFLYGDRTNQPSSRDPVNSQVRFFPAEQEKYLPLIREAEEKVYRTVEEQTKKLP
jgi:hypothetical protein